MTRLADVASRLAKARDDYLLERRRERERGLLRRLGLSVEQGRRVQESMDALRRSSHTARFSFLKFKAAIERAQTEHRWPS